MSFVNGGVVDVRHDFRAVALFEGETVGRVHAQYQCSAYPAFPLATWGVQGAFGVRVQNNLSTSPDLSVWDDKGSEEWMWCEGFGWRQEVFAYRPSDDEVIELVTAPSDSGYRDIQAQRKVLADGTLWVQTQTDPLVGNQGNHYLSVWVSVLVILP
uniref:Uncharacterized protein n=1 Tax=uncultured prokaryote TaxID=198431 RepID=A0A0H5Q704_9ZZZZ|nr:hypothetical protein [uncultured prokaryote]